MPGDKPKMDELHAVIMVQRLVRQWLARYEARRRITWNIFTKLEYLQEKDKCHMNQFFQACLTHFAQQSKDAPDRQELRDVAGVGHGSNLQRLMGRDAKVVDAFVDPSAIKIPKNFKGVAFKMPIDRDEMLDQFEDHDRVKNTFHTSTALAIMQAAIAIVKDRPNVVELDLSISRQITVIGDLHGQLEDLYMIFARNGVPSNENPYLFNGDIVDRGEYSVEVALVIMAFMVQSPYSVYINRGNHEDQYCNIHYGFMKEVIAKYGNMSFHILKHFETFFSSLPLCTVIEKKILVLHGGISSRFSLGEVAKIERHRYISIMTPPDKDSSQHKLLCDILWSDPMPEAGCEPSDRGAGCTFGPDVTADVLKKEGLQLLIRSHECVDMGHEWTHNDKVLTVFSASDYYEEGSNLGAYIKMWKKDMVPLFTRWQCSAISDMRHVGKRLKLKQRVGVLEQTAINEIKKMIERHKPEVVEAFKKKDPSNKGWMNEIQWEKALIEAVPVKIPWLRMKHHLSEVSRNGKEVNWHKTMEMTHVHSHADDLATDHAVSDALYQNKEELEMVFRLIDKDCSGHLSMEEFQEAIDILNKHAKKKNIISPEKAVELAKAMDVDKDGSISFNEFLEAFRLSS